MGEVDGWGVWVFGEGGGGEFSGLRRVEEVLMASVAAALGVRVCGALERFPVRKCGT